MNKAEQLLEVTDQIAEAGHEENAMKMVKNMEKENGPMSDEEKEKAKKKFMTQMAKNDKENGKDNGKEEEE